MIEQRQVYLPEPLPHQLPILGSAARVKVVCCGRRWGKTTAGLLAVVEGHGPPGQHRGALEGAQVWWVAPTFPIASMIWRGLKHAVGAAATDKSETERRLVLPGGGEIVVKSSDNPDGLRGAGLDGLVMDEAAYCHQDAWAEALRPALADRQGWALFFSTPSGLNWFHALYEQTASIPGWARWQRPTADNPLIPPAEIAAARSQLGGLVFSQEFEAEFVTAGAGMFKREWLRYYHRVGDTLQLDDRAISESALVRFATVDLAASLKTSADYTVIASWGLTPDGKLVLLDLVRARMEGPDIVPAIRRAAARWKLSTVWIERVAYQLALVQEARRAGLPVRELSPDRDKVARALPATALAEGGRLWLPSAASWLADFEAEVLSFPAGAHDDQVDALAYAVGVIGGLVHRDAPHLAARDAPGRTLASAVAPARPSW